MENRLVIPIVERQINQPNIVAINLGIPHLGLDNGSNIVRTDQRTGLFPVADINVAIKSNIIHEQNQPKFEEV